MKMEFWEDCRSLLEKDGVEGLMEVNGREWRKIKARCDDKNKIKKINSKIS